MADEAAQPPPWLTQLPAPGEIHFHVALGDGAELTPEIRDALERLVQAVQAEQGDVQGFSFSTQPSTLGGMAHKLGGLDVAVKFQGPASFGWDIKSNKKL